MQAAADAAHGGVEFPGYGATSRPPEKKTPDAASGYLGVTLSTAAEAEVALFSQDIAASRPPVGGGDAESQRLGALAFTRLRWLQRPRGDFSHILFLFERLQRPHLSGEVSRFAGLAPWRLGAIMFAAGDSIFSLL